MHIMVYIVFLLCLFLNFLNTYECFSTIKYHISFYDPEYIEVKETFSDRNKEAFIKRLIEEAKDYGTVVDSITCYAYKYLSKDTKNELSKKNLIFIDEKKKEDIINIVSKIKNNKNFLKTEKYIITIKVERNLIEEELTEKNFKKILNNLGDEATFKINLKKKYTCNETENNYKINNIETTNIKINNIKENSPKKKIVINKTNDIKKEENKKKFITFKWEKKEEIINNNDNKTNKYKEEGNFTDSNTNEIKEIQIETKKGKTNTNNEILKNINDKVDKKRNSYEKIIHRSNYFQRTTEIKRTKSEEDDKIILTKVNDRKYKLNENKEKKDLLSNIMITVQNEDQYHKNNENERELINKKENTTNISKDKSESLQLIENNENQEQIENTEKKYDEINIMGNNEKEDEYNSSKDLEFEENIRNQDPNIKSLEEGEESSEEGEIFIELKKSEAGNIEGEGEGEEEGEEEGEGEENYNPKSQDEIIFIEKRNQSLDNKSLHCYKKFNITNENPYSKNEINNNQSKKNENIENIENIISGYNSRDNFNDTEEKNISFLDNNSKNEIRNKNNEVNECIKNYQPIKKENYNLIIDKCNLTIKTFDSSVKNINNITNNITKKLKLYKEKNNDSNHLFENNTKTLNKENINFNNDNLQQKENIFDQVQNGELVNNLRLLNNEIGSEINVEKETLNNTNSNILFHKKNINNKPFNNIRKKINNPITVKNNLKNSFNNPSLQLNGPYENSKKFYIRKKIKTPNINIHTFQNENMEHKIINYRNNFSFISNSNTDVGKNNLNTYENYSKNFDDNLNRVINDSSISNADRICRKKNIANYSNIDKNNHILNNIKLYTKNNISSYERNKPNNTSKNKNIVHKKRFKNINLDNCSPHFNNQNTYENNINIKKNNFSNLSEYNPLNSIDNEEKLDKEQIEELKYNPSYNETTKKFTVVNKNKEKKNNISITKENNILSNKIINLNNSQNINKYSKLHGLEEFSSIDKDENIIDLQSIDEKYNKEFNQNKKYSPNKMENTFIPETRYDVQNNSNNIENNQILIPGNGDNNIMLDNLNIGEITGSQNSNNNIFINNKNIPNEHNVIENKNLQNIYTEEDSNPYLYSEKNSNSNCNNLNLNEIKKNIHTNDRKDINQENNVKNIFYISNEKNIKEIKGNNINNGQNNLINNPNNIKILNSLNNVNENNNEMLNNLDSQGTTPKGNDSKKILNNNILINNNECKEKEMFSLYENLGEYNKEKNENLLQDNNNDINSLHNTLSQNNEENKKEIHESQTKDNNKKTKFISKIENSDDFECDPFENIEKRDKERKTLDNLFNEVIKEKENIKNKQYEMLNYNNDINKSKKDIIEIKGKNSINNEQNILDNNFNSIKNNHFFYNVNGNSNIMLDNLDFEGTTPEGNDRQNRQILNNNNIIYRKKSKNGKNYSVCELYKNTETEEDENLLKDNNEMKEDSKLIYVSEKNKNTYPNNLNNIHVNDYPNINQKKLKNILNNSIQKTIKIKEKSNSNNEEKKYTSLNNNIENSRKINKINNTSNHSYSSKKNDIIINLNNMNNSEKNSTEKEKKIYTNTGNSHNNVNNNSKNIYSYPENKNNYNNDIIISFKNNEKLNFEIINNESSNENINENINANNKSYNSSNENKNINFGNQIKSNELQIINNSIMSNYKKSKNFINFIYHSNANKIKKPIDINKKASQSNSKSINEKECEFKNINSLLTINLFSSYSKDVNNENGKSNNLENNQKKFKILSKKNYSADYRIINDKYKYKENFKKSSLKEIENMEKPNDTKKLSDNYEGDFKSENQINNNNNNLIEITPGLLEENIKNNSNNRNNPNYTFKEDIIRNHNNLNNENLENKMNLLNSLENEENYTIYAEYDNLNSGIKTLAVPNNKIKKRLFYEKYDIIKNSSQYGNVSNSIKNKNILNDNKKIITMNLLNSENVNNNPKSNTFVTKDINNKSYNVNQINENYDQKSININNKNKNSNNINSNQKESSSYKKVIQQNHPSQNNEENKKEIQENQTDNNHIMPNIIFKGKIINKSHINKNPDDKDDVEEGNIILDFFNKLEDFGEDVMQKAKYVEQKVEDISENVVQKVKYVGQKVKEFGENIFQDGKVEKKYDEIYQNMTKNKEEDINEYNQNSDYYEYSKTKTKNRTKENKKVGIIKKNKEFTTDKEHNNTWTKDINRGVRLGGCGCCPCCARK